jgi:hypothetical protein
MQGGRHSGSIAVNNKPEGGVKVQKDPPVRGHQVYACGAEMERSSVVLAAGGVCCARMGVALASAGQDLASGLDHGPGSNQPVHHLRMAARRRS